MYVVDPIENLEAGTRSDPFCMICHPKTGSTSMQQCLREHYRARPVEGMHYLDEEECQRIQDCGGIVAATIRNPWDLMVSWYFYSEHDPKYNGQFPSITPFNVWIPRILSAGNGWIEKGLFYGAKHCNRLFRFEHDLETQLNGCLKDCGIPPVKLPHLLKTEHTHYSQYYNKESVARVTSYFNEEIVEWGYDFEDKS